jgi:5-methylcytosine-specific restriction endonuclease McrA
MTYDGGGRTATAQWRRLRLRVLTRDQGRCQLCGHLGADQVDHVIEVSDGGTNDETNLRAVHDNPCHRAKTARHANTKRWQVRRDRPTEPHPGLLVIVALAGGLTIYYFISLIQTLWWP